MVAHFRADGEHPGHFAGDRQRIIDGHGSRAAPAAPHPAAGPIPRKHEDDILPQARNLGLDL